MKHAVSFDVAPLCSCVSISFVLLFVSMLLLSSTAVHQEWESEEEEEEVEEVKEEKGGSEGLKGL